MSKNDVKQRILRVLREHEGEHLDTFAIAKMAGVHWYTVHRVIAELIFEDLIKKNSELVNDLIVVPIKTTKSWVFRPQLAVEGVA